MQPSLLACFHRKRVQHVPDAAAVAAADTGGGTDVKGRYGRLVLPRRKLLPVFALGLGVLVAFTNHLCPLGLLRAKDLVRVLFVDEVYTEYQPLPVQRNSLFRQR